MAISRREALKRGISYGTGVITHGNDSIVFDRALRAFPKDGTYAEMRAALEAGDAEAALPAAQAFTQLCSSLAMSELFVAMKQVEEALAEGALPSAEELDEIDAAYHDLVEYLSRA